MSSPNLDAVTEPETRKQHWARGAATRALVALPLVAGLATCGWLLTDEQPQRPVAATPAPASTTPSTIGGGAGPSVLEETAPVAAQEPVHNGLNDWAQSLSGPLGLPAEALTGFATGEVVLRDEQPNCKLSWVTLAGIAQASPTGDASGPLRISAAQWKKFSHQVPGTAKPNIENTRDASIVAGRALCAGNAALGGGTGWWKAIANYRGSELFRQQVLGNAQMFATLSVDPARASDPSTHAVRFALGQLGLPYVWGGNGPEAGAPGFDCSGLTKASYDSAGVALPRTADSQFRATRQVPISEEPKLGDLVFYGNPATNIHHVGLYLGNGLMINAPTEGQAIQIHTYHRKGDDYAGAGRPANG